MVESQEMTYDAGTAGGGAPFVCIEDALPEGGSQCLPGRMYSTPQPWTERQLGTGGQPGSEQSERLLPRAPETAEPELPLPDLMQLDSSNLTDWLVLLLVWVVLAVGYALIRGRRQRLEAASRGEPAAPDGRVDG
ncbi:hypothetical protein [Arthrobacter oryzae]|uniref:hypothetical protein n=1 Tax=Arthrobacter oryzae TaxID=409290 RepID=UPI00273B15F5|nr:hypothetical protein [Arthrobacter oryzae]WLQ07146.1 hypothetical protein Q8Z05_03050 [Arthrobacter oryzae]